jgi:hypothetical protein
MLELIAVILVIFAITATAIISKSISVSGFAVLVNTVIMVIANNLYVTLTAILAIFMIGLVVLYSMTWRW